MSPLQPRRFSHLPRRVQGVAAGGGLSMFPTSSPGSPPLSPGSPPPSSCRLRACSQHRAVPALCVTLTLRGFGDRPERPIDHEGLRPPGQPAMSPALGGGRSEGQPAVSTALGFLLEVNYPPPPLSRMLWPLTCTARGCGYPPTPASLAPSVNAGAGWFPWCHQLSKTQSTLHRVTAWTLAFLQRRPIATSWELRHLPGWWSW